MDCKCLGERYENVQGVLRWKLQQFFNFIDSPTCFDFLALSGLICSRCKYLCKRPCWEIVQNFQTFPFIGTKVTLCNPEFQRIYLHSSAVLWLHTFPLHQILCIALGDVRIGCSWSLMETHEVLFKLFLSWSEGHMGFGGVKLFNSAENVRALHSTDLSDPALWFYITSWPRCCFHSNHFHFI